MDVGAILEQQAQEIKRLRADVDRLKRQETPLVSLENAFLAAQDGRIGAAEDQLAQMSPEALAWAVYHAVPLLFPSLIGVWYMNQVAEGLLWDASQQGRNLTRNGGWSSPQLGLIRTAQLDGSTSYANRASESALQITGGPLSIMAWTYKATAGIHHPMLAKTQSLSGNTNFAYWLVQGSADNLNFAVCSGSTIKNITRSAPVDDWYFGAGAYSPSNFVAAYLGTQDGWETASDTDSVPGSINAAASTDLTIGALHGGANVGEGYLGVIALMNSTSNETLVRNYFDFTKGLFYGFS